MVRRSSFPETLTASAAAAALPFLVTNYRLTARTWHGINIHELNIGWSASEMTFITETWRKEYWVKMGNNTQCCSADHMYLNFKSVRRSDTSRHSSEPKPTLSNWALEAWGLCVAVWGKEWCGVVWCGVVWCGVVGVVWCGVVWCGVVWCGVVWGGVG
jgi:hypothetical protein